MRSGAPSRSSPAPVVAPSCRAGCRRGAARAAKPSPCRLEGHHPYPEGMSLPRVVAVAPGSPAQRAGLEPGDEVVTLNGHQPRDVIQWQLLADEADLDLEVRRGGLDLDLSVAKGAGEPLGAEVHSALFDQVRTCDN